MSAGKAWTVNLTGGAAAAVLLGLLGACSGPSAYCQTVQDDEQVLDSFDSDRTTEAYTGYTAVLTDISEVAPAESKKQWTTIASATRGVLQAHDEVGFALDDMADADERASLSESDIAVLEEAYASFNDTQADREAVVKDAQSSCDIDLK
ncbi:hypothetical protein [Aeromicrobium sp. CF3.5]|uniref:hypothetical protein n=1 Tax=Aeromicrobium sp. CF3.5 TaxID=3373078 RepID=UPI003EE56A70